MSKSLTVRDLSRLPKDWLKAPIFSPKIQRGPRSIRVGDNTWHMGVANPLAKGTGTPSASAPIDMSHVRVLFAILSFWSGENPIALSMNELAHRVADSAGGHYFRDLRRKLNDLRNYWIAVETPDGKKATFAALHSIAVRTAPARGKGGAGGKKGKEEEIWLSDVTLWPEFADMLNQVAQLALLRLDVFRSLTSDLAQSLYLFVPSRAHHCTKENPWEIRTELLWRQLGLGETPKSVRKKLLTQNKRSVLTQLDGAETRYGKLRITLGETVDGLDYKLQCWQEGETQPSLFPPDAEADAGDKPSLLNAWRESGRTATEFQRRLAKHPELDPYEEEKLRSLGLDPANRYWRMAKALLDSRFTQIIGQMAVEVDSGKGPKNVANALNWRLRKEIAARPTTAGPAKPTSLARKPAQVVNKSQSGLEP